ncbi:MAG: putative holin [Desulfotalea sp.]
MKLPKRLTKIVCLSLYLVLLLLLVLPVDAGVLFYKMVLVCTGATLGWWLDFYLFPYSRPAGYLMNPWQENKSLFIKGVADYPVCPGYETVFVFSFTRRAVVVVGLALGFALGL